MIRKSYGIFNGYGVEAPGIEPRFGDTQVAGIMPFLASSRSGLVALRRFSYRKVREVPDRG